MKVREHDVCRKGKRIFLGPLSRSFEKVIATIGAVGSSYGEVVKSLTDIYMHCAS